MNQRIRNLSAQKQHLFNSLLSLFCMGAAIALFLLYYTLIREYTVIIPFPFLSAVILALFLFISAAFSKFAVRANTIREQEKQLSEIELEKMRVNLLRAVSHDLRTPLTGIIGNSSLFLDQETLMNESAKRELVSNIYQDATWLLHMVENLLSVTRIQGDNLSISTQEESVEEVIADSIGKIETFYPDTDIRVTIPDELILLPMDAILIEQVAINLMSNAVLHSENKGPIDLIVRSTPHAVSFSVRDYGVGIPPAKLNHLFDGTAYTPSSSSDACKGMGIGLSICKTIITAHHGTILGRNHENGAEFVFTLPRN